MMRNTRLFRNPAFTAALLAWLLLPGCERVSPQSGGGSATLDWTTPLPTNPSSPAAPVAGYKVFYGTSQRALYSVVVLPDPHVRRYVVGDLAPGTWYFAVAAYTRDNVQGALSNIASKTIR